MRRVGTLATGLQWDEDVSGESGSENRAAGQQAQRGPAAIPWSPGFVRAALLSTLTIGTVFGAASLLVIHAGRVAGWVSPGAHATAQLFGFVFLLIGGGIADYAGFSPGIVACTCIVMAVVGGFIGHDVKKRDRNRNG